MARIVLVEDDGALQADLAATLIDAGHQVRTAANGLQGLQTIKAWRPHLVISDINMPHVDGVALRRHIEKLGAAYADMAFIFLSAISKRRVAKRSGDVSFEAFISKPVSSAELLATVDAALCAKRAKGWSGVGATLSTAFGFRTKLSA